jgi:Asp-tRNA(Asn)/Glu-tRNA(Gln) amidotransferase A subunit family amidase
MPQEYFLTKLSPDITECVREVVSGLQAREATVVPVSLPSTAYALGAYHVVPWGAALQQCGVLRWGAGARAATWQGQSGCMRTGLSERCRSG